MGINKRGGDRLISEQLVYIILSVAVLITIIIIYSILTGKASGALGFLKNMLRLKIGRAHV